MEYLSYSTHFEHTRLSCRRRRGAPRLNSNLHAAYSASYFTCALKRCPAILLSDTKMNRVNPDYVVSLPTVVYNEI